MSYQEKWRLRRQALDERVVTLKEYLQTHSHVPRISELQKLTNCLELYARGNFEFFLDGFDPENENLNLVQSDDYPPDHVFRGMITQPFEDVLIIERIALQRINAYRKAQEDGNPQELNILQSADKLAWDALQPAVATELIPDCTTVITYFQKSGNIRIIPYAPIALIGIPFTAKNEYRDLLSIPHEVGHYVYRRAGRFYNGSFHSLRELITFQVEEINRDRGNNRNPDAGCMAVKDTLPDYIAKWTEEIFADYYGCCVAGATIAVDFQDLQTQFSRKRFVQHDGEHPPPILRPRIYTKVLHEFSTEGAAILENRWAPKEGNGKFVIKDGHKGTIDRVISRGAGIRIGNHIERILNIMIKEVAKSDIDNNWNEARWWTITRDQSLDGVNAQNIDTELYDAFINRILDVGQLDPASNAEEPENQWPRSDVPDLADCGVDCDLSALNEENRDKTLTDWPALFFPNDDEYPNSSRPVRNGNRDEDVCKFNKDSNWWIWDVFFRAGWNTFGNGEWAKGP